MINKILYTALFLLSLQGFSQEIKNTDTIKESSILVTLKGQVIDNNSKMPLSGTHLFNLNSVIGTVSNEKGIFELATTVNDTIYISYLGYQSIKLKITNDLLKGNELVIELYERTEQMKEIVVNSHKLIGVLEIDAKNVPKDKFSRIHINGMPQTYEVSTRQRKEFNSPIDALFRPIDYVYNMFGKSPAQLKKLKKLKDDDKLRNMLDTSNRELLMEYLGMTAEELNELLNECNYSDYFIKSASDLQLIEAVLLCYENHKAIKKGSTVKEN
ncbi:MAG: carboxypeptidase-like regulatory domain-containing protein [Lutibacter sp.]